MRRSCFHPRFVLYFGLIKYYQEILEKNVLILPFELLKQKKTNFLLKWQNF